MFRDTTNGIHSAPAADRQIINKGLSIKAACSTHSLTPLYLEVVNLAFRCAFRYLTFCRSVRSPTANLFLFASWPSTSEGAEYALAAAACRVVAAVGAKVRAVSEPATADLLVVITTDLTLAVMAVADPTDRDPIVAGLTAVKVAVAGADTVAAAGSKQGVVAVTALHEAVLVALKLTEVAVAALMAAVADGAGVLTVMLAAAGRIVETAGFEGRVSRVLLMRLCAASSCFMFDSLVVPGLLPRTLRGGDAPCGGL